jgi:hypothetical protein
VLAPDDRLSLIWSVLGLTAHLVAGDFSPARAALLICTGSYAEYVGPERRDERSAGVHRSGVRDRYDPSDDVGGARAERVSRVLTR